MHSLAFEDRYDLVVLDLTCMCCGYFYSYPFRSLVLLLMVFGDCSMFAVWLVVGTSLESALHFSTLMFLLLWLGG